MVAGDETKNPGFKEPGFCAVAGEMVGDTRIELVTPSV
jgi:hypothetical protein